MARLDPLRRAIACSPTENQTARPVSGSNASVEHTFSILTNMLSDRHLLVKHRRMESILIIGANYKNWTVKERGGFSKRYLSREKKKS